MSGAMGVVIFNLCGQQKLHKPSTPNTDQNTVKKISTSMEEQRSSFHAVTSHSAKGGDPTTDNYVVTGGFFDQPIAFTGMAQGGQGWAPPSCPTSEDCALPLDTKRAQAIAFIVEQPMCIKGAAIGRKPEAGPQYGEVLTDGSSYTLNASETHGVLAFTQNSRDEVRVIGEDGDKAGSLSAEPGTHQTTYLAYRTNAAGQVDPQGDKSAALTSQTDPCTQILAFDSTQVTSKTNRSNPKQAIHATRLRKVRMLQR